MAKGETTKARILSEAVAMTSERGIDAVTIGDLSSKTGLSKSGLFRHFESKENLQVAILETAADLFRERVITTVMAEKPGVTRLRRFMGLWLDWANGCESLPCGCPFAAASAELDDRPGPARDALVGAMQELYGFIAARAQEAIEVGEFAPSIDPEDFAFEVAAIELAYHHFHRLIDDPRARQRAVTRFEELIERSAAPVLPARQPARSPKKRVQSRKKRAQSLKKAALRHKAHP